VHNQSRARKLSVAICLAVVLPVLLTACGSSDSSSATTASSGGQKPVRVAFFGFAKANTFAQATFAGVERAAKAAGSTAEFFDGKFDAKVQLAQIQSATTSGKYDAFVVQANDGNAIVPALQEAIAKGIKVVGVFTPIGPDLKSDQPQVDGMTSFVGESIDAGGRRIGQLFVDFCKGKNPCPVAYMPGDNTLPLEIVRTDAVKEVIAKSPNIKLVATPSGGYDRDAGLKAAQTVLTGHSDVLAIGASGDQPILGAEQAVNAAGKQGRVALIGSGASIEGVQAIRDGRWYGSIVWLPETFGAKGTEFAIDAVRGQTPPASLVPETLSPVGPLATRESLAKSPSFKGQWHG
jgi:ribose transport system substrate-binding protein